MTDKVDRKSLAQKWVHSHEEDTPNETVFRPASYTLPPSRGRQAFQLDPQGTLLSFGPGPDDRTVQNEGRWELDRDDRLHLRPERAAAATMQVLSVGPDKLVVKRQ
jgi:hypothetical protein